MHDKSNPTRYDNPFIALGAEYEAKVAVTFFKDHAAQSKTQLDLTLYQIRDIVLDTAARSKNGLPWLKLAVFGDKRTDKNSLRHDDNVLQVTGVELDYDDEGVTFEAAWKALLELDIRALLYTSPSHKSDAPRWRIIAPTSKLYPPEIRKQLVARLNGSLKDHLAMGKDDALAGDESFTLSQAYFYGRVQDNPDHMVEVIGGTCIDTRDDLAQYEAIGEKTDNTRKANDNHTQQDQRNPFEKLGDDEHHAKTLDELFALLQSSRKPRHWHIPMREAIASMIGRGWPREQIKLTCAPYADGGVNDPDVDRLIDSGFAKFGKSETETPQAQASSIEFLNIAGWDDNPAPPRPWVVQDYVPLKQPTLLSGEGGTGKTILLLQLCVAAALGQDWIGLTPTPGPVIYLGAEDDADELHRRLDCMMNYHGEKFATIKDRLFVTSYADKDATLARPDQNNVLRPTRLYQDLLTKACDIKPVIIALDTVSDIYAGNENDRVQVSAFLRLLRSLAMASGSGVIINSHPSLQGISSGSGLSGSTAWHGKVRSRMYFKAANTNDKGEDIDPDLRVLEFRKNNYGPINASINLRWSNGLYLPEPSFNEFDHEIANRRIDDAFVTLILRFRSEGRVVSSNPGKNYAPAIFAGEPEFKDLRRSNGTKRTNALLAEAMQRLFVAKRIYEATDGPPSRRRTRLEVLVP